MSKLRLIPVLLLLILTDACRPRQEVPTLPPMVEPLQITNTPSKGQTSPDLSVPFPLIKGTRWTYTKIGYTQSGSDPAVILKGTGQIVETVVDTQSQPPYWIAHIHSSRTVLTADPGWDNAGFSGPAESDFWYLVLGKAVYKSQDKPVSDRIHIQDLSLEFQFPMLQGMRWCPAVPQKDTTASAKTTPESCAYAGMRSVETAAPYQSQAGNFASCFQLQDHFNSGGVIQWYCDGVGIVSQKYDHLGTKFGYSLELTQFEQGKP